MHWNDSRFTHFVGSALEEVHAVMPQIFKQRLDGCRVVIGKIIVLGDKVSIFRIQVRHVLRDSFAVAVAGRLRVVRAINKNTTVKCASEIRTVCIKGLGDSTTYRELSKCSSSRDSILVKNTVTETVPNGFLKHEENLT